MRYIQIPSNIIVKVRIPAGPENTRETSFQDTMTEVWLNYPKEFGETGSAIRVSAKLEMLFANKTPGTWVPVEDADFQRLERAVENCGYNPAVARQLVPFIVAIQEARKDPPPEA
jgi:hypothetical protein